MNGTRRWNPALSVPENLPRRSITHACCCGTTRAIREMRIIAKTTTTTATIKVPNMRVLLGSCANVQRQTDYAIDDTFLAARQRRRADIASAPRGAAHLRAAVRLRGHVLEGDGVLAADRIDVCRLVQPELTHDDRPHEDQQDHRRRGEEDQLEPERATGIERDQDRHQER